jgi:hypothetical protein
MTRTSSAIRTPFTAQATLIRRCRSLVTSKVNRTISSFAVAEVSSPFGGAAGADRFFWGIGLPDLLIYGEPPLRRYGAGDATQKARGFASAK